jgi:hypothetical protein
VNALFCALDIYPIKKNKEFVIAKQECKIILGIPQNLKKKRGGYLTTFVIYLAQKEHCIPHQMLCET